MTSHDLPAQQHLATLRWLLLSPPLVVAPSALPVGAPRAQTPLAVFTPSQRDSIALWLEELAQGSQLLTRWLQARPQARIGRYAEDLLEFYLTHGPQHCLAAAHVPLRTEVNGAVVTHGELDFLLTDALGQRSHWELAVKFFLCTATGDTATPVDFIGPNGVETLAHKWHKLFAKQLTHLPPAPWDAHSWQPQAFTRGWMFYRWGSAVPRCDALHVQHCKGWWVDWADMAQLPEGQYVYLPRLQWMAPVASLAQLGLGSVVAARSEMQDYLATQWASTQRRSDAQMVVLMSGSDGAAVEVQRFFICPSVAVDLLG